MLLHLLTPGKIKSVLIRSLYSMIAVLKFTHCHNEPYRKKDHIEISKFTKFGFVSLCSNITLVDPS